MSDPVSWLMIEPGWRVLDGGGGEIGTVKQVLGDVEADIFDGLALSRGVLDPAVYLPAERVGTIEAGVIYTDVADPSTLTDYNR
jgi:hypothetical protein